MPTTGRIILQIAAALIIVGSLYDLLAPRLPRNLMAICGENEPAKQLARQLLRALGGSLLAIGVTVGLLASGYGLQAPRQTLLLILLLVLLSEGINSFAMYRVGSPYYIPLFFVALTMSGVLLAWPAPQ